MRKRRFKILAKVASPFNRLLGEPPFALLLERPTRFPRPIKVHFSFVFVTSPKQRNLMSETKSQFQFYCSNYHLFNIPSSEVVGVNKNGRKTNEVKRNSSLYKCPKCGKLVENELC